MKQILFGLLFVALTTIVFGQNAEMDPDAAKNYNDGNNLLKSGQLDEALHKYNAALKSSKDYRIFYQKAVTLKKMNKYTEAEDAFKKAIESNPNFDIAYNGLGGTYFVDGQYRNAIEAFKKFGELTSKAAHKKQANEYIARAYAKLGEEAKRDGKYNDAIDFLVKGTEYFDFDAGYLLLAEVYVETNNYDKALEAADKALNSRKSIPRGAPFYYKGKAFKGMGDIAKAKEAFEETKKDPKYKSLGEYELKLL